MTPEDIARLAVFLGIPEEILIRDYTALAENRRQLRLTDQADGACVFLRGNRCAVYAARPVQCRAFPFPDTSLSECPGLTVECIRPEPGGREVTGSSVPVS